MPRADSPEGLTAAQMLALAAGGDSGGDDDHRSSRRGGVSSKRSSVSDASVHRSVSNARRINQKASSKSLLPNASLNAAPSSRSSSKKRAMPQRTSSQSRSPSPTPSIHVSPGMSPQALQFKTTSGVRKKPVAKLRLGRQPVDPAFGDELMSAPGSTLLKPPPPSAGKFSIASDDSVSSVSSTGEASRLPTPAPAPAPAPLQTEGSTYERRRPPPLPERRVEVVKDRSGNAVVRKASSKRLAPAAAATSASSAAEPPAALSARDRAAADARAILDLQSGSAIDRIHQGNQVRKGNDFLASSASQLPRSVSAPSAHHHQPPLRVPALAPKPPMTPPTPASTVNSGASASPPRRQHTSSVAAVSPANGSELRMSRLPDPAPVPAFGPPPLGKSTSSPLKAKESAPPAPSAARRLVEELHDDGSAPTPLPEAKLGKKASKKPSAAQPAPQPIPAQEAPAAPPGADEPASSESSPTQRRPPPAMRQRTVTLENVESPPSGRGALAVKRKPVANASPTRAADTGTLVARGAAAHNSETEVAATASPTRSAGAARAVVVRGSAAPDAEADSRALVPHDGASPPAKKPPAKVFVDAESVGAHEVIDVPQGREVTVHVLPARTTPRGSASPPGGGAGGQLQLQAAPSPRDGNHAAAASYTPRARQPVVLGNVPLTIASLPHGANMPPVPQHWRDAPVSGRQHPSKPSGPASNDDRLLADFVARGGPHQGAPMQAPVAVPPRQRVSPRIEPSAFASLPAPLQQFSTNSHQLPGPPPKHAPVELWGGIGAGGGAAGRGANGGGGGLLGDLNQIHMHTAQQRQRVDGWASGGLRMK